MKKRIFLSIILVLSAVAITLQSCSKSAGGTGKIVFYANGEDFVREGFLEKKGWKITFDHLYVNIANPVAYNSKGLKAELEGTYLVDLAEGDSKAKPIVVGTLDGLKEGNYQSLKFGLKRAEKGDYKGYSIVMIGKAEKGNDVRDFTIKLDEEIVFDGKEGYVGDEVKGMLLKGKETSVEMTFHFDHVFGDRSAPANDHVNSGSVGFDYFNAFAKNGKIDVAQKDLVKTKGYKILLGAIATLGHLGEGHCHVLEMTSSSLMK